MGEMIIEFLILSWISDSFVSVYMYVVNQDLTKTTINGVSNKFELVN